MEGMLQSRDGDREVRATEALTVAIRFADGQEFAISYDANWNGGTNPAFTGRTWRAKAHGDSLPSFTW